MMASLIISGFRAAGSYIIPGHCGEQANKASHLVLRRVVRGFIPELSTLFKEEQTGIESARE
jgi:hypothetical protein